LASYDGQPTEEKKNLETTKNDNLEEGIKELSLFQKPEAQKKSALNVPGFPVRKEIVKIKGAPQNEMEEAISDAEGEKNSNVIYKEKEKTINNHIYRHLIFSPNVTESTFRRFLILTYRGLVYAKKCLKQPSEKFIHSKQIVLKDVKSKSLLKKI